MAQPTPYQWNGGNLLLCVRVQPRASKNEIVGIQGEHIKIRITAPPVEGKANNHLIQFLAKSFGVAKSRIQLLSGESCREKRLCIESPNKARALELLSNL